MTGGTVIPFRKPGVGDQAARDRIRGSLGESLIVEASAGTGKTSELVQRLVQVLQTGGGKIDHIAAVTFTHKAAGELKLRLRQKLDEARQEATDPVEIENLEDALKRLEEAVIGTIHAFCAQILRERPVEAQVDPAFEELTEGAANRIYDRAFRSWLQRRLNEPSPALRRALVRLSWADAGESATPIDRLKKAGRDLIEWRDFPAPWRRPDFDARAEVDALVEQARYLASRSGKSLRPLREFLAGVSRAESNGSREYDLLEGQFLKLRRDLKRDNALNAREPFRQALDAYCQKADADLAAALREEMRDLVSAYAEMKRRAGKLDFNDLLIFVRDLLRNNAEVRRHLQERFTHLFVDEFQDTDPLQAEILILLASGDPEETSWLRATPRPGKLFLVGDPKQSIYKFRRADLSLYRGVSEEMVGRGVGQVKLTRSFRSVKPIQDFVNAAFSGAMAGAAGHGHADYSPLEDGAPAIPGQPAIVALPPPYPYGKMKVANTSIEECLPDTVVAFVEWLLKESNWRVRDPLCPAELLPIQSQHIAILFRRFTSYGRDLTREYVRAFEARDIRHLLVGSKSFQNREEIETLRAALTAIEWPDDELSVFAALKGPLFGIVDSTLLKHRAAVKTLHPFRRDAGVPEVNEALEILAGLHRERNQRPIADTVAALLEVTRAHAGFALRPAGHQVLANVHRVITLARNFEIGGGVSFRSFVEELNEQADKADTPEAPVLEEGAEGVRIMTVHNAKGLEFPVVVLADMTCKLCHGEPERYIDARQQLCAMRLLGCAPEELRDNAADEKHREEAEGVRVAYVAATRARDLLVVPACGDEEREGWLSPLNKALYPQYNQRRHATRAAGCPSFGPATVLKRPPDYPFEDECSVMPGAHRPQAGQHEVVWWDPSILKLQTKPRPGLLHELVLAPGESAAPALNRYKAWQENRAKVLAQGKQKMYQVFTPTEAVAAPDPPNAWAVKMEAVPKPEKRSGGRLFGTLVHLMLRDAELGCDQTTLGALAQSHARALGLSEPDMDAAVSACAAALSHALVREARMAERVQREWPLTLQLEDGRMLEGTLDLAYLNRGKWTIIDFKTDADMASKRTQYERQLQWYSMALSRITGQPVEAVLLSL